MGENIAKLIRPADIITLANALFGFASIIMTMSGQIESAVVLIIVAVIADGADGAVARYSGFGLLGANLDSLSDAISFGVAPAVAAFVMLSDMGYLSWVFPGFFMICGILRLARFNISGKKDGFEGIPITAGGFLAALFIFINDIIPNFQFLLIVLLFVLSLLMVSTISYPKIKKNIILAPVAILTIFNIAAFFIGYDDLAKKGSLLLFMIILIYILSPVRRIIYDRNQ